MFTIRIEAQPKYRYYLFVCRFNLQNRIFLSKLFDKFKSEYKFFKFKIVKGRSYSDDLNYIRINYYD